MQSPSHKLASVKRLLVGTKKRKKDAIKVLQKWTIIAVCVFTLACILSSSFPNGNIHLGRAAAREDGGGLGMRACVVVNLPLCDTLHWGEGGNERAGGRMDVGHCRQIPPDKWPKMGLMGQSCKAAKRLVLKE